MATPAAQDAELAQVPGRVRWRCRRGMKELDLVLLRYLRQRWAAAQPAERSRFEQLLQWPDPELAACLLGHLPAADPSFEPLLALLREK